MVGGGGVFRDWRGARWGGFVERMGVCSSVRTELRAVLRRLVIAKEKGFRKLIINVDFGVVVDMLRGNVLCNARYKQLSRDAGALLDP